MVAAAATHLLAVSAGGSHVWVPGLTPGSGASITVSFKQGPKERASLGPWYAWVQSCVIQPVGAKRLPWCAWGLSPSVATACLRRSVVPAALLKIGVRRAFVHQVVSATICRMGQVGVVCARVRMRLLTACAAPACKCERYAGQSRTPTAAIYVWAGVGGEASG